MKLRICLLFFFAVVPCCTAQQDCTRTVLVSFYDQPTKNEIQTLKTEDFEIKVGDKKFPVVSSTRDFTNRLLILVETTGASKNSQIDEVVSQVILQARQVDDGEPVAFGIFGEKAIFTKGFFSDPKERTRAIAEVMEEAAHMGKRVALWEALDQAVKMFGPHQPGDTVLVITDPYDDKSRISPEKVEKEFIATGTRLFMMRRIHQSRVDQADFGWSTHAFEKSMIDRITQETGGLWSEYVPTLLRFAWAGYMIQIKLPEGMETPQRWKVQFRGDAATIHRHTNYYFPAKFPGCSHEPAQSEK